MSYAVTLQTPATDSNSNTKSTPPPKIRMKGTGLELKHHKVDRNTSPGNEKKLVKAGQE